MSERTKVIAIYCDYPNCRTSTPEFTDDFYHYPTAPGWERWAGKRRTMDYCPPHAHRPKAPTMRQLWPASDLS